MRFVIALACSALLIALLAKPLKRHPAPFYLAAILLDCLYVFGVMQNAAGGFWPYFLPLMQRCALAFVLFSIVMFIGVLSDSSKLRARLIPIRRQLSILACIFASCHILYYAASYLPRLGNSLPTNLVVSLAFSLVVVILMLMLLTTSFLSVKAKMSAVSWKKIQWFAYPFYLLTYVHLLLLLLPSALAGKDIAVMSLSVYSVIVLAYVVLRIRKRTLTMQSASNPVAPIEVLAV